MLQKLGAGCLGFGLVVVVEGRKTEEGLPALSMGGRTDVEGAGRSGVEMERGSVELAVGSWAVLWIWRR